MKITIKELIAYLESKKEFVGETGIVEFWMESESKNLEFVPSSHPRGDVMYDESGICLRIAKKAQKPSFPFEGVTYRAVYNAKTPFLEGKTGRTINYGQTGTFQKNNENVGFGLFFPDGEEELAGIFVTENSFLAV